MRLNGSLRKRVLKMSLKKKKIIKSKIKFNCERFKNCRKTKGKTLKKRLKKIGKEEGELF